MGLSSAAALDVMITVGLSYYLKKSKTGFTRYVWAALRLVAVD